MTTQIPFLALPGENPFLEDSPRRRVERLDTFETLTGLARERTLSAPPVRIPIPVRLKTDPRWAGVTPAALRNPLFWLPDATAYRRPDESNTTWAIRVMLDIEESGLYDRDTGLWTDVIGGIITDSEIAAWQAGENNAVSHTNLNGTITGSLAEAADELASVLVPAQWALTARSILSELRTARAAGIPEQDSIDTWARYAAYDLRELSADPDLGVSPSDLLSAIAGSDTDPGKRYETMIAVLTQVEGDYSPYLDGFLHR